VVEQFLPDHNESISSVLEKFGAMGIDTPGVVALLGMHYSTLFLNPPSTLSGHENKLLLCKSFTTILVFFFHKKYLIKFGLRDLGCPYICNNLSA